ncbi:SAM-dependent methyltransferase, partial [Streptomyces sp. NPDC001919]
MRPAADRLAELLGHFLPGPLPVRLRAWDGSQAGPPDAPTVVLRSPEALRRVLWQPGELGLAEAYVSGDLDVDGDLAAALSVAGRTVR